MEHYSKIRKVLLVVLVINVAVAIARLLFGYAIDSSSMIADGVHAFSDGFSNVIGLLGLWIASRPADKHFPYGYRKFETLAVLGISFVLIVGALEVLRGIISRQISGVDPQYSAYALGALIITIIVNIGVVFFEKKYSKEYHSHVLHADSEHTKSDLMVSFSVVAAVIALKFGIVWLDAIVAIAIVFVIARIAYKLVTHSAKILADFQVLDPKTVEETACSVEGVTECHAVKARGTEHDRYVDMHIRVNPQMSVKEAHDISEKVEEEIKKLPGVKGVIVHVEPEK